MLGFTRLLGKDARLFWKKSLAKNFKQKAKWNRFGSKRFSLLCDAIGRSTNRGRRRHSAPCPNVGGGQALTILELTNRYDRKCLSPQTRLLTKRAREACNAPRLHRLYRFRPLSAAAKRPAPFFANFTEARPAKDGDGVGSGGEEENFGA